MLSVASIREDSLTAGLSPNDNKRTEIFLAGCKKALSGDPCPECFNHVLWDPEDFPKVTSDELFEQIEEIGNKYITFVGGEPLDQWFDLTNLLEKLTEHGYHIVLITHHRFHEISSISSEVLSNCNVIIDGEYEKDKRIFDENKKPGIFHVIGSSNQNIWHRDGKTWTLVNKDEDDLEKVYSE